MKTANNKRLVLVTAPDVKVARSIATQALKSRLIACANLLPGLESHYWWKHRVEHGKEVLILLKTDTRRLATLEELITRLHPYDTPEIVSMKIDSVSVRYLAWWSESLKSPH